jgi:uncharacterized integral membrane protein
MEVCYFLIKSNFFITMIIHLLIFLLINVDYINFALAFPHFSLNMAQEHMAFKDSTKKQ